MALGWTAGCGAAAGLVLAAAAGTSHAGEPARAAHEVVTICAADPGTDAARSAAFAAAGWTEVDERAVPRIEGILIQLRDRGLERDLPAFALDDGFGSVVLLTERSENGEMRSGCYLYATPEAAEPFAEAVALLMPGEPEQPEMPVGENSVIRKWTEPEGYDAVLSVRYAFVEAGSALAEVMLYHGTAVALIRTR